MNNSHINTQSYLFLSAFGLFFFSLFQEICLLIVRRLLYQLRPIPPLFFGPFVSFPSNAFIQCKKRLYVFFGLCFFSFLTEAIRLHTKNQSQNAIASNRAIANECWNDVETKTKQNVNRSLSHFALCTEIQQTHTHTMDSHCVDTTYLKDHTRNSLASVASLGSVWRINSYLCRCLYVFDDFRQKIDGKFLFKCTTHYVSISHCNWCI